MSVFLEILKKVQNFEALHTNLLDFWEIVDIMRTILYYTFCRGNYDCLGG